MSQDTGPRAGQPQWAKRRTPTHRLVPPLRSARGPQGRDPPVGIMGGSSGHQAGPQGSRKATGDGQGGGLHHSLVVASRAMCEAWGIHRARRSTEGHSPSQVPPARAACPSGSQASRETTGVPPGASPKHHTTESFWNRCALPSDELLSCPPGSWGTRAWKSPPRHCRGDEGGRSGVGGGVDRKTGQRGSKNRAQGAAAAARWAASGSGQVPRPADGRDPWLAQAWGVGGAPGAKGL